MAQLAVYVVFLLQVAGVPDLLHYVVFLHAGDAAGERDVGFAGERVEVPAGELRVNVRFQVRRDRIHAFDTLLPAIGLLFVDRHTAVNFERGSGDQAARHLDRIGVLSSRIRGRPGLTHKGQRGSHSKVTPAQIDQVEPVTVRTDQERGVRLAAAAVDPQLRDQLPRQRCGAVTLLSVAWRKRDAVLLQVEHARAEHHAWTITARDQSPEHELERFRAAESFIEFLSGRQNRADFLRLERAALQALKLKRQLAPAAERMCRQ